MLVLQRKTSQSLMIGDNIKISIVEIGTDRVKIAIDAPKEISIMRTELLDAAKSNREAMVQSADSLSLIQSLIQKKHKED